jgi:hypothetical protein
MVKAALGNLRHDRHPGDLRRPPRENVKRLKNLTWIIQ